MKDTSSGIQEIVREIDLPVGITLEVLKQITNQPNEKKQEIEDYLRALIQLWPSQIITGGYTIGNLSKNPDNLFIVVRRKTDIRLIINYNPKHDRYIFCGSLSNETEDCLIQLLGHIQRGFFLCAGKTLPNFIGKHYIHQASLRNKVYILDKALFSSLTSNEMLPTSLYLLDGSRTEFDNEELMEDVRGFYGYDAQDMNSLFKSSPHVVLYYHGSMNSIIVSGARCNEFSPEIAIIGGVQTQSAYRGQGYGFAVCFALVKFLIDKSDQIALETDLDNFPATKIYEKLGFKKVGSSTFYDKNVGTMDLVIGNRDY